MGHTNGRGRLAEGGESPMSAVYGNFDFAGPLEFVNHATRFWDRDMGGKSSKEKVR
jgi:hypothetical protein